MYIGILLRIIIYERFVSVCKDCVDLKKNKILNVVNNNDKNSNKYILAAAVVAMICYIL